MTRVIPERLAELAAVQLGEGAHDPGDGYCVMEAVAYVAGEPHTDRPHCVCPVIAALLRSWNDDLPDDATRTRLLAPLIPRLAGSRATPEIERRRSYLALDWLVRVMAPAWLDLAGLHENAGLLRDLGELCDEASCRAATDSVSAASAAVRDAAWDAARDAVCAAASAAAWAAVRAAAGAAAWDAAGAAVRDAAWAARSVFTAAANEPLQPTVERLQASALDLVDRMLSVGGAS